MANAGNYTRRVDHCLRAGCLSCGLGSRFESKRKKMLKVIGLRCFGGIVQRGDQRGEKLNEKRVNERKSREDIRNN